MAECENVFISLALLLLNISKSISNSDTEMVFIFSPHLKVEFAAKIVNKFHVSDCA